MSTKSFDIYAYRRQLALAYLGSRWLLAVPAKRRAA